jgi:hypothetical protein
MEACKAKKSKSEGKTKQKRGEDNSKERKIK